ncbi:T6D22.19-like protein [Theobroma cacao]|uniref:T6D22.19-like protein n=1 Tax=Theobroma cacao TaxID=3641 RepID=A0A061FNW3_THECC|nr:T6D22.19-like protein [Theobroma cacao]
MGIWLSASTHHLWYKFYHTTTFAVLPSALSFLLLDPLETRSIFGSTGKSLNTFNSNFVEKIKNVTIMDQSVENYINMDDDVNILNEDEILSQSHISESEQLNKRAKKETSNVWNYFTKIGKKQDRVERATCNGCKTEYKVGPKPGGSNYGTSHLRRHIDTCKFISYFNPHQMLMDYEGKVKARKFYPRISRDMLAEAIIKHYLPHAFVEYDKIRAWAKYVNPDVVMPSRNTAVSDVQRIHLREKEKLKQAMAKNLHNEDEVIKDMSQMMKMKFEKYWKDYSVVLTFGAILDPRMKLDFLRFCYSKIDASTCHEKLENVKTKLYELFEQYASNTGASGTFSHSTSNLPKQAGGGTKPKGLKIFSEFKMFQNETISIARKFEFDVYLGEAKLDYEVFEDLNVLNYWKDNAKRFPDLSVMARDVLSISITTVASESAFSIGGHVLTKFRSSLHHENVEMLVCTKNWLHGFSLAADDDDSELETSLLSK